MTLYDIYDAWTYDMDTPVHNGTHAERIDDLKDYVDEYSIDGLWDCAHLTDEEAELIVTAFESDDAEKLKGIRHTRNYYAEFGNYKDGNWTEFQSTDETDSISALSAKEVANNLSKDWIANVSLLSSYPVKYEETLIRIAPLGADFGDKEDEFEFFTEENEK